MKSPTRKPLPVLAFSQEPLWKARIGFIIDFGSVGSLSFPFPRLPLLGGFLNGLLLQTHFLQEGLE